MHGDEAEITLGPVLFNWRPEQWRDFYFRIADEAPVDTVYVGEAICSKRAPLFDRCRAAVLDRLDAAGKTVVLSTLSEVVLALDRKQIDAMCAQTRFPVEANDTAALLSLAGRAHRIGPFMNVYNEATLAFLAGKGADGVCVPAELPAEAIRAMGETAAGLGVALETQVFGRMPLALSARCYHARVYDRTRDSCLFVCEKDPDGLELKTLEGSPFLAINGIQTLSHEYLNLVGELADLKAAGVSRFRLSPHSCDMVAVAEIFRAALDRDIDVPEALARLGRLDLPGPFCNGFYHHRPGNHWHRPGSAPTRSGAGLTR
ncbi:ubiquinone anaerobic biosynthesis protein UbiV [Microbaculum sp. FT89]|uniref:ubiquinone anaerobic biosynthesis protein UbiV n=1 Tax=Microbaculum sp. FT89 TaxID=3447298 RepID=UPI003F533281